MYAHTHLHTDPPHTHKTGCEWGFIFTFDIFHGFLPQGFYVFTCFFSRKLNTGAHTYARTYLHVLYVRTHTNAQTPHTHKTGCEWRFVFLAYFSHSIFFMFSFPGVFEFFRSSTLAQGGGLTGGLAEVFWADGGVV